MNIQYIIINLSKLLKYIYNSKKTFSIVNVTIFRKSIKNVIFTAFRGLFGKN